LEAGQNQITALWVENGSIQRKVLAKQTGLNHGLTVNGGFLYASSPSTLYRWSYSPAQRTVGPVTVVVRGIPANGHQTRTPVFDSQGVLFLSLGSASNIDKDSTHARVKRFVLSGSLPVEWASGMVWADGLRNEVGLGFDKEGRLWGVMNGMDDVYRDDLGGDIHNLNPAEQLNLLSSPGKFYGYPYCWSEYNLPKFGKGAGTMWAHNDFVHDGIHNDAWCQNKSNVEPPSLPLPPHNAPLDIMFWYSSSFPADYQGDAFVTFHGSWDRQPPSGYRVQRIKFENGQPTKDTPFLWHNGSGERWPNNFRPVGLAMIKENGKDILLVSSDANGEIVSVKSM